MIRSIVFSFGVVATFCIQVPPARAHWTGPSNPTLKTWFDSLDSGKGLCCSFADGLSIADVDWDTATVADAQGKPTVVYRVRLNGQWIDVPPDAVVPVPNKFGPAVVWPVYTKDNGGHKTLDFIRCFLPGAGA